MPADPRYGVVLHTGGPAVDHFLTKLNVDWYLNFTSNISEVPEGKNKVPFIRVPTKEEAWASAENRNFDLLTDNEIDDLGFLTRTDITEIVQDSPGSYWYVFGEPNKYIHIDGAEWAPVFYYLTTTIKQADPTAKIIGTSLLNWDYMCEGCGGYHLGQTWFNNFIEAYKNLPQNTSEELPEVDIWAIDIYPIDWINTPNTGAHSVIVFDQIEDFREGLDLIGYDDTPIWITEIAIHWGFDGWALNGSSLVPIGTYHWDNMSDYLIAVLEWLEANASNYDVEKWFFFKTYADVYNPVDYAGVYFFDGDNVSASLNCLGEIYFAYATNSPKVQCDAEGNTIPQ